ncbi:hypothetical protein C9374_001979 [Naegleria lovaniensis]|uniref:Uncharacterized protein n=1 Tax=Naegleria lovaniensis TaxID=51637 RepID=A0AA88GWC0_NAELO|nr:uncharacterized protein C9374_001979 [Naegleria lovaniensis]KAG2386944.1 hypothetical protein C9374_001979 [Naegleria lovaniensis]
MYDYSYDISLLENPNKALKTVIRSPFNHTNITSVFFDPELQAVFVSYDNHCVCIFNVHSNEKIGQIRGVNCKHLFVLNHQLLVAHVVETQHSTSTTLTTTGTSTTTTSKLRSNTFMNTQHHHSNNNHTQQHSTRQHFIQIWNISSQHNSIQCSLKYSTHNNNNTWNSHPHIMEIFQVSPHTIYLDGNVKKEMQVIVCGFGNSSSSGGGSDEGGILVLYDLLNQSESVKSLIFHTNNNNTNSNNISHKGVYCYSIDQDRDSLDDLCICGLNDGTIMEFNLTQMNPQLEPRILNTTSNSSSNSSSSNSSITLNVNTHQSIECLAFDGALMRIASGGCEGSICVWEVMSSSTQTNTIHTINTTTTTDVNSINQYFNNATCCGSCTHEMYQISFEYS